MFRNLSAWSIRNPITPIVIFLVLSFLGIISFIRMPINNMPDVAFPLVQVNVTQPGAAPSEMETQITQKIEGAVAGIGNVRNIQSATIEGLSSTFVEFQLGTPIDRAVNDVRDAVTKVRSDLPENVEEPIVERIDVEGGAIVYYSVGAIDMTPEQLSWFVDDSIAKTLLTLPGVAQVSRSGGVSREIRVDLNPARMQALGVTAATINAQLRALNLDAPGGRGELGGSEQAIRVLGGAKTPQALKETRIFLDDGRVVRLGDIADVRDGTAEVRSLARLDGRDVTSFAIFKAKGASDVAVKERVDTELAKISKANPKIEVREIFTTVDYTIDQYRSAIFAMMEGALLAIVVVWFFLRDWRATFISALAIPLSAIPAFWVMDLFGFTLNTVSLLGLSLVAGILVDDAIVEIENIVRHMRMGKPPLQAALEAADEIGLAVVATTSAIIAVFLPVSFMGGLSGQYFKQFGLTVAAAVFMSLLVARMVTPLIAAYFLKPHGIQPHASGPNMERYLSVLRWSLHHRWVMIGAGLAFFAASIGLMVSMPSGFMPSIDNATSQVKLEVAPGARLDYTASVSAQISALLRKQPEVIDVFESIGADDSGEPRTSTLYVNLVPHRDRDESVEDWEQRIAKEFRKIPDARINFISQDGGFGRDITIMIAGDDPAVLHASADAILADMRSLPYLQDPRINGDLQRPELVIKPRFDLAADLGVSVAALSQTVRIATLGDIEQNMAKFSLKDRQIPIRVSLVESARSDLSTLENLPVPTLAGGSVPLKAVAELSFGQGPTKIRRYNQNRRIVLEADLNGIAEGDAYAKIYALPSLKNLPDGVERVDAGTAEFMLELMRNFMLAIVAGTLLVISVLVLLYKRVFQPFTNLGSLLLAPGGAMIALILTGHAITMPVFIGVLMLFGIVAKNSILLVDFAIEEMRAGKSREEAILEAAHKRAQPIVMTTVAMIAGMLPVAIGLGADTSFRAPMAIAVIGGLITSTALTLLIVPAAFTLVDDIENWVGPRLARLLTHKEPTPKPHPAE
jgi:multidrug efflux pump subunit AcrB